MQKKIFFMFFLFINTFTVCQVKMGLELNTGLQAKDNLPFSFLGRTYFEVDLDSAKDWRISLPIGYHYRNPNSEFIIGLLLERYITDIFESNLFLYGEAGFITNKSSFYYGSTIAFELPVSILLKWICLEKYDLSFFYFGLSCNFLYM